MSATRLLLADDHPILAEGLKRLLEPEFELVGIVEDGRALVEAAGRLRPDLIIADVSMGPVNGIDALVQLKQRDPLVKVLFLTMHREVAYARRALDAGAVGFVLKSSPPDELLLAIRSASKGQTFISPSLASEVLHSVRRDPALSNNPVTSLTPRRREILQLLAAGRTAKEISSLLDISTRTVESHKYEMMQSTGAKNSAELVHFAIKHGIVEI